MWPLKPERITLRACDDFDWRVMACCPRCRHSTGINTRILAGSKYGGEPLYRLLERGIFKCRKRARGCEGEKAERLTVSAIHVGDLRTLAEWVVLPDSETARLVRSELSAGLGAQEAHD